MSTIRTLAAALAVAAVAAPGAQAKPAAENPAQADMHASTALAQPRQDLRSADARDAAKPHVRGPAMTPAPGQPTWPENPQVLIPPKTTQPAPHADSGVDWVTIGIGVAGSVLAISGVVLVASRRSRRLQRARAIA
jgi:hypothetical protein